MDSYVKWILMCCCLVLTAASAVAQSPDPPRVSGTWHGAAGDSSGRLQIIARIQVVAPANVLGGAVDLPTRAAYDLGIRVERSGDTVTIDVRRTGITIDVVLTDSVTLTGHWREAGITSPITLRRVSTSYLRRRPQEPVPPYPYTNIDLHFPGAGDNVRLAGTLSIPQGGGRHPVVVLIGGSGPLDRDGSMVGHKPLLVVADQLARNGIAVLRADPRGVGASGGQAETATPAIHAADVTASITALKKRTEIDTTRIGLIGHSEGGVIAPLVAREGAASFMVLLAAPSVPAAHAARYQASQAARRAGASDAVIQMMIALLDDVIRVAAAQDSASAAEVMRKLLVQRGAAANAAEADEIIREWVNPRMRWLLRHDVARVLEEISVPTLALYGELDVQVTAETNAPPMRAALERNASRESSVRIMPGLNHLFQTAITGEEAEYGVIDETISPGALDAILTWIKRVIQSDPASPSNVDLLLTRRLEPTVSRPHK